MAETTVQTKECPFCAEQILAAAKKCKHCGERVDGASQDPARPQPVAQPEAVQGSPAATEEWDFSCVTGEPQKAQRQQPATQQPMIQQSVQMPPGFQQPHVVVINQNSQNAMDTGYSVRRRYSTRSRMVYILFALFLFGLFGSHNFYAGRYGPAIAQLLLSLTFIGLIVTIPWVLIECFVVKTDGNGVPMS